MLEELNLDYQIKRIDITKNEQFNEYFSKISPLNKIPVIKYNEDVVIESGEILIYLAKKIISNFMIQNMKRKLMNG